MFTRQSATEPKLVPGKPGNGAANGAPPPRLPATEAPAARPRANGNSNFSVISNDLRILGQDLRIITAGSLQVDGEVEGDIRGNEVIIGERGQVRGTVAAERVIVQGRVAGVIRGQEVALQASAKVEGDIHHLSLSIERGAEFDGRVRRPANAAELQLDSVISGNGATGA